jgi:hypothetical protein
MSAREYRLPAGMCDPHLEELHDLKESGEERYMLERIREWREYEREECEFCQNIVKLSKEKGWKV